tara:strand:- start:455 stop:640 length:186 start_codon:yes stop_codon:yes gene_type:complete
MVATFHACGKTFIAYRMQTLLASGMSHLVFEFRFGNSSVLLETKVFYSQSDEGNSMGRGER